MKMVGLNSQNNTKHINTECVKGRVFVLNRAVIVLGVVF